MKNTRAQEVVRAALDGVIPSLVTKLDERAGDSVSVLREIVGLLSGLLSKALYELSLFRNRV